MNGKRKCKLLKSIRQKIARDNDIPFVSPECTHQGDCLGTCPKCEEEVQYLEQELAQRGEIPTYDPSNFPQYLSADPYWPEATAGYPAQPFVGDISPEDLSFDWTEL